MKKKFQLATKWTAEMDNLEARKFECYLNMFVNGAKSICHPRDWDTVRESIYRYVMHGDTELSSEAKVWNVDKVLEAMNKPEEKASAQALRDKWKKMEADHTQLEYQKHVAECTKPIDDCALCRRWHVENPTKTVADLRDMMGYLFTSRDAGNGRQSWERNTQCKKTVPSPTSASGLQ